MIRIDELILADSGTESDGKNPPNGGGCVHKALEDRSPIGIIKAACIRSEAVGAVLRQMPWQRKKMENQPVKNPSLLCGRSLDLQGHRGARGKRPENTIPAFAYCMENHMTTIELDTNVTRDRRLIIHHDTHLNGKICLDENRRPAAPIPIRELTVEQLKRLDCGAVANADFPEQVPVPGTRLITLDEFFDFVKAYEKDRAPSRPTCFNVETKFGDDRSPETVREAARLVVAAIEAAGMVERTTVQSFVLGVLPEVKNRNPRIKTSALFEPSPLAAFLLKLGIGAGRRAIVQKALAMEADIISPDHLYVSRPFIRRCHEHGLKVLPWVLNEEPEMERLIRWGVDGIISDYPDRLHRVYERVCHGEVPGRR